MHSACLHPLADCADMPLRLSQDVPTMPNGDRAYPILVLDVWEHAYYLGYKNNRGAFVDDWWGVVNWHTASQRFEHATEAGHSNEL